MKDGLDLLGVSELLQTNATVMQSLFTPKTTPLTADAMFKLFHINWSPTSCSQRDSEEAVIVAWAEYLYSTEGK